jgi:hypothetical protein
MALSNESLCPATAMASVIRRTSASRLSFLLVKLTLLSRQGKEAVVAILGVGDFFGEGCLAGQPLRMGTAVSMTGSSIMKLANVNAGLKFPKSAD